MSSWRSKQQPPRATSDTRSAALADDILSTPSTSSSSQRSNVPSWLIEQQRRHLLTAGRASPPPPPPQAPAPPESPTHPSSPPKPTPQEHDVIMVDLLDGAHLHSLPTLSHNSDSIISLPPISHADTNSQTRREEAQATRRKRNGPCASVGAVPTGIPRSQAMLRLPIPEPLDRRRDRLDTANGHSRSSSLKHIPPPDSQTPLTSSRVHSRHGSIVIDDDGANYDNISFSHSNRSGNKRRKRRNKDTDFHPSEWGWKRPAETDSIMPSGAWFYLALIGCLTFAVANLINMLSSFLSASIIGHFSDIIAHHFGTWAGLSSLMLLRSTCLAISFVIVLKLSPQYSAGSGIPEMKCVLSGVLLPRMLNWETLLAKSVGLVFSLASAISIGRLGPFIHISCILAALIAKIPVFTALQSSALFQLQALSAAMAAGVGATFGAPIGGTMLSIEVMSTYYYIHWLPMALYCSIMGYYCVVSLVPEESRGFFYTDITTELKFQSVQRLLTYALLGAVCGIVGAGLVQFTRSVLLLRSRYFGANTPGRTTVMVAAFAAIHTLVTHSVGGVIALDQKEGILGLMNSTKNSEGWLRSSISLFENPKWNTSVALSLAMMVKFVLTGLSLAMPVPAGTFTPIFETGALLGRSFGELCSGFAFVDWVDPRVTAVIAAASLASGTLHTTSIAVVMLELTREAIDVLPLAVGVIVSYAVSKHLCSDLFSEIIKIRRLPFILGLRERYPSENKQFYEDVSNIVAGSFMATDFPFVTPQTTRGEIRQLLTQRRQPWMNCAFLSDAEGRKLWGTISRKNLEDLFADEDIGNVGSADGEFAYGTFEQEAARARQDSELVPFLSKFNPLVGHSLVDMGPMQVSIHTPFWKMITLFRMLSMSSMYVMEDGTTVGYVTKAQVIAHSFRTEAKANRKRKQDKALEEQRLQEEKQLRRHFRTNPPSSNRLASRLSASDIVAGRASLGRRSRPGSIKFGEEKPARKHQ